MPESRVLVAVESWDRVFRVHIARDIEPYRDCARQRGRLVGNVKADRDMARIAAAVVDVIVQNPATARPDKIPVAGRVLENCSLVPGRDDTVVKVAAVDDDEMVQPDAVRRAVVVVVRDSPVGVTRIALVNELRLESRDPAVGAG